MGSFINNFYVNNGTIGGSPFRVVALAGPTNCGATISVRAPRCVAGTVSEAPIFAKDRQGNQRVSGGDVFSASLELDDARGREKPENLRLLFRRAARRTSR